MSKERVSTTKVLTHVGAALGGVAVGYLSQRRRINRMNQENEDAKFKTLRFRSEAEQAAYDEVTGLPRRWAIYETYAGLEKAWRVRNRTRSGEQAIHSKADRHSILMLDLDRFKAYNDSHGHNAGDRLLGTVSEVLTDRLRDRDVIARWGGEEFITLLPRATEADAVGIAEELRKSIEATGQINVSIGVTEIELGRPIDDSIERADQAAYAAKENGRNQVVAYSSLHPVAS